MVISKENFEEKLLKSAEQAVEITKENNMGKMKYLYTELQEKHEVELRKLHDRIFELNCQLEDFRDEVENLKAINEDLEVRDILDK